MQTLGALDRLKQYLNRRYGVADYASVQSELADWLRSDYGQQLMADEKSRLDPILADLFGYHLLELSISDQANLSDASRIQHCFALSPNASSFDILPQTPGIGGVAAISGALADIDSLPLESESLDVVVLHHVLEFSQLPHQLLREVHRVLMPRGHVVIIGFNPNSLFGLFKLFGRLRGRKPQWRHHSLGRRRLVDWLSLLEFTCVHREQGFYRPPVSHWAVMKYLKWLEVIGNKLRLPGGNFYFIVAHKDVNAVVPMKPDWQAFSPMAGLSVRKPTTRMPEALRRRYRNEHEV